MTRSLAALSALLAAVVLLSAPHAARSSAGPFVAPADAGVLPGVVERPAGEVEDLAHGDAAGAQVGAGGVDIGHGEDQAPRRAGTGR